MNEKLIEELENARRLVDTLAHEGARNWTMSVPPRPDDTDLVLAKALDNAMRAIAALSAKEPAKPEPLPEVDEWIDSRLFAAGRDAVVTTDEIREYIAKLTAAHKAEIDRLKCLLKDAADDLADWGSYVPEYFVEKHKLDDDIQKYRNAGSARAAQAEQENKS